MVVTYGIADIPIERVHMHMPAGAGEEAEAVKEKVEDLAARAKQAVEGGMRVV